MEEKLIDYRLSDLSGPFKNKANDRALLQKAYCNASDRCQAFKDGECNLFKILGGGCPHGRVIRQQGYTKRASKFSSWVKKKREEVKGIEQLSTTKKKLFQCGDYICFDFPHWYLNNSIYKGNIFKTIKFIKKEEFTTDLLYEIINSRPQALMGGEIKSYQKEVVPSILMSLSSNMPELFKELIEKYPDVKKRVDDVSLVGRQIKANTLKKGSVYNFERYGEAKWDGEQFHFDDYGTAFLPIKGHVTAKITPREGEIIKVQSDDQVADYTVFI